MKSATKKTCPCCLDYRQKWLYRAWDHWYCVACMRGLWGCGPRRFYERY